MSDTGTIGPMTSARKTRRVGAIGRTFDDLVRILEKDGILTAEQALDAQRRHPVALDEARQKGKTRKYSPSRAIDPARLISEMSFRTSDGDPIDEDIIAEVFSKHAGFKYVKLDPLRIDSKLVTETLTLPFARQHTIIPVFMNDEQVIVATDNPYELGVLDQIRALTKKKVEVWVASGADVQRILRELFGFRASVTQAATEFGRLPDLGNLEAFVTLKSGEEIEASDTHVVNAVEYLLRYAFEQGASDIHIEPHREDTAVRMRIDGVLHEIYRIPAQVHPPVISRIKSMGRLDIAEKRRPQDGRIKTAHNGREIELRISTLPVAFGEKIVIRALDPQLLVRPLTDLGLYQREVDILQEFISRPHGLLLVTGPTGSGKTTTLYSLLQEIASPDVNVTTIEDPIEMVIEQFNQVGVNPAVGLDFSHALRTILRQDPDIIMVGEIRDGETARMAVQASLTGHLVLSTVHTNDSTSAITRLRDLGVPDYLLSSTLVGVVAQRLMRRICNRCKKKRELTEAQCKELKIPLKGGKPPKLAIFEGIGCQHCRETGYRGRSGVYEMLPIGPALREKIADGNPLHELRETARQEGMITLRDGAIKKLAQGVTTYQEVLRVTASSDVS